MTLEEYYNVLDKILEIIDDPKVQEEIDLQCSYLSIRADDAYQAMFEERDMQLEKIKDEILKYKDREEETSSTDL